MSGDTSPGPVRLWVRRGGGVKRQLLGRNADANILFLLRKIDEERVILLLRERRISAKRPVVCVVIITRDLLTVRHKSVLPTSTQGIGPMVVHYWPSVYNAGPIVSHHSFNALFLLGLYHDKSEINLNLPRHSHSQKICAFTQINCDIPYNDGN